MKKSKYSFLNNHFTFQCYEMNPNDEHYLTYIKNREGDEEIDISFTHGASLWENDTKEIIDGRISGSKMDFSSFEFYLNQLPDLELNNVAYMFSLVYNNATNLLEDAFSFPKDYPSEFAKSYLMKTYGRVVTTDQFTGLLSCCLIGDDNNHNYINESRRKFCMRYNEIFEKLEALYLPDGYSLYKLLEDYTPIGTGSEPRTNIGTVFNQRHVIAWDFIKKAKKYITE